MAGEGPGLSATDNQTAGHAAKGVLLVVCVALFFAVFEASAISVILPDIADDLSVDTGQLQLASDRVPTDLRDSDPLLRASRRPLWGSSTIPNWCSRFLPWITPVRTGAGLHLPLGGKNYPSNWRCSSSRLRHDICQPGLWSLSLAAPFSV